MLIQQSYSKANQTIDNKYLLTIILHYINIQELKKEFRIWHGWRCGRCSTSWTASTAPNVRRTRTLQQQQQPDLHSNLNITSSFHAKEYY